MQVYVSSPPRILRAKAGMVKNVKKQKNNRQCFFIGSGRFRNFKTGKTGYSIYYRSEIRAEPLLLTENKTRPSVKLTEGRDF